MSDDFNEIIGNYFTKEEWEAWTRGEFNLFDNFAKRTGMTQEDANRLKSQVKGKLPPKLKVKPPFFKADSA